MNPAPTRLTLEDLRAAAAPAPTPLPFPATPAPAAPAFRRGAPAPAERPATARQRELLKELFAERAGIDAAEKIKAEINAIIAAGSMNFDVAKEAITDLIAIKRPAAGPAVRGGAWTEVPDGYYAVPSATGNNDLDFFNVYTVDEDGEWKGFRGVARVIGGRSDAPVKGAGRRAALEAIRDAVYTVESREVRLEDGTPVTLPARDLTGPEAAAFRYADEIGRCRVCNRHLTNETSRINAIGPVCAGKE